MPEAARTLVKSPPELWAELSDLSSLTRHLGAFGEIRITRLVPESTVAWEGDRASGTVDLEPAGWGTKVIVRADESGTPVPEPEAPTIELPAAVEPAPGLLSRLFRRRPRTPEEDEAASAEAAPVAAADGAELDAAAVLDEMLDTLGSARHRPFSRG